MEHPAVEHQSPEAMHKSDSNHDIPTHINAKEASVANSSPDRKTDKTESL